jgi:hypothetical protein
LSIANACYSFAAKSAQNQILQRWISLAFVVWGGDSCIRVAVGFGPLFQKDAKTSKRRRILGQLKERLLTSFWINALNVARLPFRDVKKFRAQSDLNQRLFDLQSKAFPLSYAPLVEYSAFVRSYMVQKLH